MLEKHGAAPPMIVDYDGEWLAQEIRHHILRSYPFFFFCNLTFTSGVINGVRFGLLFQTPE